jgi:hypothetical protein
MKLLPSFFILLLCYTTASTAQDFSGTDCTALLAEATEMADDGCVDLDTVSCITEAGAVRTPPSYTDNHCETARYMHCPTIVECYAGCASQSKFEEYYSCLAVLSIETSNGLLKGENGGTDCKLDCSNFDYSDGLTLGDLEAAEGSAPENVLSACDELSVDLALETVCDFEGKQFTQCLTQLPQTELAQQFTNPSQICNDFRSTWCPFLSCAQAADGAECSATYTEYAQCHVDEILASVKSQADASLDIPSSCDLNCDARGPENVQSNEADAPASNIPENATSAGSSPDNADTSAGIPTSDLVLPLLSFASSFLVMSAFNF